MVLRLIVSFVAAVGLHLTLGWAWTILAGVVAGAWIVRRGWLVGALTVTLEWLTLVVYNFIVAGREVSTMIDTVGGIMGNLPGGAVVAITLLIGAVLGAMGGLVGSLAVRAFKPSRVEVTAQL